MEYKSFPIEFKEADDLGEREFVAYAAAFGNVDDGGDVIVDGAFDRTLQEQGKRVQLHYAHEWPFGLPVGPIKEISTDEMGLKIKGSFSETTLGNDVYTLAKDGALKEMSIGYAVPDNGAKVEDGVRYLLDVDLYEVSFVPTAMNPQARVEAVKSMYHKIVQEEDAYEQADPVERYMDDIDEALSRDTREEQLEGVANAIENAPELPDDVTEATLELVQALAE